MWSSLIDRRDRVAWSTLNIPNVLLPVRQQCLAERDGGGARGAGEGISEWLPEAMGDVERRRRRGGGLGWHA